MLLRVSWARENAKRDNKKEVVTEDRDRRSSRQVPDEKDASFEKGQARVGGRKQEFELTDWEDRNFRYSL
jgi:hypothetical protein